MNELIEVTFFGVFKNVILFDFKLFFKTLRYSIKR